MKVKESNDGRNYEVLIKRAFNCAHGKKHGASRLLFQELVALEMIDSTSISYRWRFQKLKNYLARALSKLKKRKCYLSSDEQFSPILKKLNAANTTEDLAKIASLGIAKIIECEKELITRRSVAQKQ